MASSAPFDLAHFKKASFFERQANEETSHWKLEQLEGRLVELSGAECSSALSLCFDLILQAQNKNEPVAWLSTENSIFFPPDTQANGIDLEALPVIALPSHQALGIATERLLRSGAFSLLVLDLGSHQELSLAMQSRLASLAQKHATAVVFITQKTPDIASLGSLISLRAHTRYLHCGEDAFLCELEVLKDKRHAPGDKHQILLSAPEGLL
ncbi:MAG: recombinase A [Myxococcales bacterium]|nr:MAG: recombinase A [Myxococcales bacterium]